MKQIFGHVIDNQTRCKHYFGEKDIIAIKFKCCNKYYPCYKCHQENETHEIEVWKKENYNEFCILCGVCKNEHSLNQYLNTNYCLYCKSDFNERCEMHYHLYFETWLQQRLTSFNAILPASKSSAVWVTSYHLEFSRKSIVTNISLFYNLQQATIRFKPNINKLYLPFHENSDWRKYPLPKKRVRTFCKGGLSSREWYMQGRHRRCPNSCNTNSHPL